MRLGSLKIQHAYHMSTIVLKAWNFEWMFKFVSDLTISSLDDKAQSKMLNASTQICSNIAQKLECAQLLCAVSAYSSPIACPRYFPLSGSFFQQISLPNSHHMDWSDFTLSTANFHVCSLQHFLAQFPKHIYISWYQAMRHEPLAKLSVLFQAQRACSYHSSGGKKNKPV